MRVGYGTWSRADSQAEVLGAVGTRMSVWCSGVSANGQEDE